MNQLVGDNTLNRLNHLSRWQGFPTHHKESVAQHSYWVTYWTSLFMSELCNNVYSNSTIQINESSRLTAIALRLAIFHDVDEAITGDVAHPVKYNPYNGPEIRSALKVYAKNAIQQKFPDKTGYHVSARNLILGEEPLHIALRTVVKVADYLSMFNYAVHEFELGNSNFNGVMLEHLQELVEEAVTNSTSKLTDIIPSINWDFTIYTNLLTQISDVTKRNVPSA
jgi:5'-deoxynucleotidase YfbR-like HD superfamily hydrolase